MFDVVKLQPAYLASALFYFFFQKFFNHIEAENLYSLF